MHRLYLHVSTHPTSWKWFFLVELCSVFFFYIAEQLPISLSPFFDCHGGLSFMEWKTHKNTKIVHNWSTLFSVIFLFFRILFSCTCQHCIWLCSECIILFWTHAMCFREKSSGRKESKIDRQWTKKEEAFKGTSLEHTQIHASFMVFCSESTNWMPAWERKSERADIVWSPELINCLPLSVSIKRRAASYSHLIYYFYCSYYFRLFFFLSVYAYVLYVCVSVSLFFSVCLFIDIFLFFGLPIVCVLLA